MKSLDKIEREYLPPWFYNEHPCGHCGHALETEDLMVLSGWMGTNWDEGVERVVRCPNCDRRGQIKAYDNGNRGRLGAAAPPRMEEPR